MTLISEMETPTPLFQQTRVEKLYYFSTNFLKLCTRDPLLLTQLLTTNFFKIRPTSGLMAYFRFSLV